MPPPIHMHLFVTRKAGISPSQFKIHMENNHIPLIQARAGESFPLSHTRHYIARTESSDEAADPTVTENTERNSKTPATVWLGTQADFDYDVISELVFRDQSHVLAYRDAMNTPETLELRMKDEEAFMDTKITRLVILDEVCRTEGSKS